MRREPGIERAPGVFEGFFMGTADGGSIIADACTMERFARKGHAAPLRRQSRKGCAEERSLRVQTKFQNTT